MKQLLKHKKNYNKTLTNLLTTIAQYLLCTIISFYRYCISPILPLSCRYLPTCSDYTIQAILSHGPIKGIFLGLKRVLRCNPWAKYGFDPVPINYKEKKNEYRK